VFNQLLLAKAMCNLIPFVIPAAWDSKKIYNTNNWIYQLTQADIQEINQAFKAVIKNKIPLDALSKNDFPLPHFSKVLNKITEALENEYGIFLVRGFPVHSYSNEEIKLIFAGIGLHMGVLMKQSKSGDFVCDVTDKGEKWGTLAGRGASTSDPLPFHTDRCDIVALLCLNKPKFGGESRVVSSVTIHNQILAQRPDLLEILYQPFYHRRALWENEENSICYTLPIFTAFNKHFACRFLRLYINLAQDIATVPPLNKLQITALNLFEEIANNKDFYIEEVLEQGDIQFLNNYVTLHARCPYRDGDKISEKRHLLRLWLSVPNSRPLSPEFKPLFKNTAAGSIRGGA
jgi:hypothetical protein